MSLRKLIRSYQNSIRSRCIGPEEEWLDNVAYWQNKLFSTTIEYVIPLSLITLVPGVWYCFQIDLVFLAAMDALAFLIILYIGFGPGASVNLRKVLLIFCTYFTGTYLLVYVGFKGPGFLFLYAACVFAIIVLPVKHAYVWSWINVLICGLFALVVYYDWSIVPEVNAMPVAEWMAISVNLLFLSFVSSALLPVLFTGLSRTFQQQNRLQHALIEKHKSLEDALNNIAQKNAMLREVTWMQSHEFRGPLARMLGLIHVLQDYDKFSQVKMTREQVVEEIKLAAEELDRLVRQLNKQIESSND